MTEIYMNQNEINKFIWPSKSYFVYSHNKSFDQRTDYGILCKNEHPTTFIVVTKKP